ncbi:hypothetical protein H4Q26_016490 [Puccinia striiformis f. sp. tritici PST-130]|nr:hypothetical protein H4Q26_016490 [Puccinia striiformis f. sp. tritici PST-130]
MPFRVSWGSSPPADVSRGYFGSRNLAPDNLVQLSDRPLAIIALVRARLATTQVATNILSPGHRAHLLTSKMTFLVSLSRYQLFWYICWCSTVSLAPGPVGLGRFRESSSSSSEWSSEETHSPPPVHFPDQFAHNYLTDNDDRSSASYSDYSPSPRVYIYRAMSLNAHQAMKWNGDHRGGGGCPSHIPLTRKPLTARLDLRCLTRMA